MIDLPERKMTGDEFLAWAESLPKEAGRYELWDGEVIVIHGPSGFENAERSEHWVAKFAIARALYDAVQRAHVPCHVTRRRAECALGEQQAGRTRCTVGLGPGGAPRNA